jgi:hypothetical protein
MSTHPNPNVKDEAFFRESYQRVLPEMQALAPEDVAVVSLDVISAVTTTLGILGELRRHRDAVAKDLPNFDLARFDKLEEYTMALSYASSLHSAAIQPPDDLKAVYETALGVRETLHRDVTTLIGRELIAEDALKQYNGSTGFRNVAADLQLLAIVLQNNWANIEGKCATQAAEFEHAFQLASRIFRVVGLRETHSARIAEAAEIRARAFTLFSHAYDDARRAMIFLRWHEGDADTIAPSLYAGRGSGRKKTAAEIDDALTPTPTAPPVAAPEQSPSPKISASVAAVGPFMQ